MEKNCSKCQRRLPYSAFGVRKSGADGLYGYCIDCGRAACREYQRRNKADLKIKSALKRARTKDEISARSARYYAEKRDVILAKNRDWYHREPGRRAGYNAAWQRANAEALRPYYAEKTRRRFATLRKATPAWANAPAILAIYEKCRDISVETGIKHHVDHIVPLVSPLVCGLHVEWNLQILTACDNLAKSNKFEPGPYPI